MDISGVTWPHPMTVAGSRGEIDRSMCPGRDSCKTRSGPRNPLNRGEIHSPFNCNYGIVIEILDLADESRRFVGVSSRVADA